MTGKMKEVEAEILSSTLRSSNEKKVAARLNSVPVKNADGRPLIWSRS